MTTDNVTRLADLLIECSDLYGSIDKAARWLDAQGVTTKERCAEIVRQRLEYAERKVRVYTDDRDAWVTRRMWESVVIELKPILAEIERGEQEET